MKREEKGGFDSDEEEVQVLVEHLFRRKAGQMIASLTRLFGPENLQLAEDVVQETMLKALRKWSFYGIPENPGGWLFRVAKNGALDVLRREKRLREKQDLISNEFKGDMFFESLFNKDNSLNDDQLTLVFICCHPIIGRQSQVALALKTVGGFSVSEIARAFLLQVTTVAQRLVRAKRKIREARIPFKFPKTEDMPGRLEAVLEIIYLLFNEGYSATAGDSLIRRDLCEEAIRLAHLLVVHSIGDLPAAHALLALMHFQNSRSEARVDTVGNLLLLSEQNRSKWDKSSLRLGFYHLDRAGKGEALSRYHLMAGIASCHASAESYETTDWENILFYYECLCRSASSPVYALNKIVALGMVAGPAAALAELELLRNTEALTNYYLLPATIGEMLLRNSQAEKAGIFFREAFSLATNPVEKLFLQKRIQLCGKEPSDRGQEPGFHKNSRRA